MNKRSIFTVLIGLMILTLVGCKSSIKEEKVVNLYPAYESIDNQKKWGYIDENGEFIVEAKYDRVDKFGPSGLAKVELQGNLGVINSKGEEILKTEYQNIGEFKNGYFPAFNGKFYQLFDYQGVVQNIGSNEYIHIGPLEDGLLSIVDITDDRKIKYGYIDKSGKLIIEPKYALGYDFYKDRTIVKDYQEDKYLVINKKEDIIKELDYEDLSNTLDREYFVYKNKDKIGIIDYEGNPIIELDKDMELIGLDRGLIGVGLSDGHDTNYGIMQENGQYLVEPKAFDIVFLGEGLFAISDDLDETGYRYYIINSDGNRITDNLYYLVGGRERKIERGIISVSDGEKTFALDRDGRIVDEVTPIEGVGSIYYDGLITEFYSRDGRVSYYKNADKIWEDKNIYNLSKDARVEEERYVDQGINIKYPVIKGLKDTSVEQAINEKVYNLFIGDNIGDFKYYFTEYRANRLNDMLILEQVIEVSNEEFQSDVVGNIYNIDLKTGKFYELKDLFKDGSSYIDTLTDIVRGKAELEGNYDLSNWDGVKEDQNFIAQRGMIDIYFSTDEIISYSGPFSKFTIDQNIIEDILDLNSEFWWTISVSEGF